MSGQGQNRRPAFSKTLQVISPRMFRFSQDLDSSLMSESTCIQVHGIWQTGEEIRWARAAAVGCFNQSKSGMKDCLKWKPTKTSFKSSVSHITAHTSCDSGRNYEALWGKKKCFCQWRLIWKDHYNCLSGKGMEWKSSKRSLPRLSRLCEGLSKSFFEHWLLC